MVYDFGARLQCARKNKGLTQKQVADKLGLHRRTIMAYENNSVVPSLDVFKRLAILYGVSSDYLLGLEHAKITPSQLEEVKQEIERLCNLFEALQNQSDP